MDNLTHSLVGALIGQAGLKRRTGLAMPALVIGANVPDIDAACLLWLDGVEHLAVRRGITHGPIAWMLLPLILAGALYGFDRWQATRGRRPESRAPVHFGLLYALSFIACLTHPALDWLNTYGVRLLEPFSSRWFYGDVLFIIDVWLWAGLGLATWLSLRREKRGGAWRQPARIALAAGLAYIGGNAALTWAAERAKPAGAATIIASPPPVRFWAREVIAGGDGLYRVDGAALSGTPLARCDLAAAARAHADIAAFLFWSRTPFVAPRGDGSLWLRDARYADPRIGGRFAVRLPDGICAQPAAG